MELHDILQSIGSLAAVGVAVYSAAVAKTALKAQKGIGTDQVNLQTQANNLQTQAQALQQENNRLQDEMRNLAHGQIEFQMTEQMTNARNRLSDVVFQIEGIKKNYENDLPTFQALSGKMIREAQENYLNVYDGACAKYIDGKVDKERFKKNYFYEVKQILENESFKDFFPAHTSPYQNIVKIHEEWHRH